MINKNKIIIILTVVVILAASTAIYLNKRNSPSRTNLSQIEKQKTVLGLRTSPDNSLIYFDKSDLTFYTLSGTSKQVLYKADFEPFSLAYTKDRKKVMLIGDVKNVFRTIRVIDFNTKKTYVLNNSIVNASFSPDGTKISYQATDDKNRTSTFFTANFDGSDPVQIGTLPYQENTSYLTRWSSDKAIYVLPMEEESDAVVPLFKIDLGKNSFTIIAKGPFTDIVPSPDSSIIATTVYTRAEIDFSDKPVGIYEGLTSGTNTLHLVDLQGNDIDTNLEADLINITWDKESSFLYAFGVFNEQSGVYKVSRGGMVTLISKDIPKDVNITELELSPNESQIFISNNGQLLTIANK
jgi:hypothetical protein